jgi:hypothetical protein
VSETSSRENNARVEAVTRMSTEKSGCDWNATCPYNARPVDVPAKSLEELITLRSLGCHDHRAATSALYTVPSMQRLAG